MKKIIIKILISIFLLIFILSTYIVIKNYLQYKENQKDLNTLLDEAIIFIDNQDDIEINWNYLKTVNPDICGWIYIQDTSINYPIVKDNNSLYYITHNFNKKYNKNGAILTLNENPFEDKETVVYGHNLENGIMFSDLSNYFNKDFLTNHSQINIYTEETTYIANIFSVYSINVYEENNNIKNLNFKEKIEYYKQNSIYTLEQENILKIIKLCTCSYLNNSTYPTNQRYYIVFNLIEK